MSFSINKVKESLGLSTTPEIYRSAAVKQFPGAFSMGTSKRRKISKYLRTFFIFFLKLLFFLEIFQFLAQELMILILKVLFRNGSSPPQVEKYSLQTKTHLLWHTLLIFL